MKQIILAALFATACQIPAPSAPLSPPDARDSTFRVDRSVYTENGLEDGGSGTAWIAHNDSISLLITAGHVCAGGLLRLDLVDSNGHTYPVAIHHKSEKYDLCMLRAEKVLGAALELAPSMPEYDEPVMAVGAPMGVYGCNSGSTIEECGMAPISRGYYAGGTLVSMPMTGGNSGSAVFTARGVFGVLVEGYRIFDSLSFVEPRSHLVEFLEE